MLARKPKVRFIFSRGAFYCCCGKHRTSCTVTWSPSGCLQEHQKSGSFSYAMHFIVVAVNTGQAARLRGALLGVCGGPGQRTPAALPVLGAQEIVSVVRFRFGVGLCSSMQWVLKKSWVWCGFVLVWDCAHLCGVCSRNRGCGAVSFWCGTVLIYAVGAQEIVGVVRFRFGVGLCSSMRWLLKKS